jgi:C4-dicarboxylate-binding protein DctP
MKRYYVVFLIVLLALVMVVPVAVSKKKPIKIRFSHVVADNTPKGWAAKEFAARANKALKGKVKVTVFPNAQLYDDNQAIEALSAGFIEMAAPSSAKFVGSVPQLQLFDQPFLFATTDATHKTIDGPIGKEIMEHFSKRGLKALAVWDNGFKDFTNNKHPLIKPEDFKGIKFRIMSSDILEAQMHQVHGVGLKLPFGEVYNALEQGVVDGQENTPSNIYSKKLHEVQNYYTISNHGYLGYVVITTERFWNKKLPADVRATLERIMAEVTQEERLKAREMNAADLAKIKEYAQQTGRLKIHELTPQEKVVMQKTMEPVHKMFPQFIPARWIDEIYKLQ